MRWLLESDLLENTHFPIMCVINMVTEDRFATTMINLCNLKGFGENYGSCCFWSDLDDYDKEITPMYDGVDFYINSGESVIISCNILYYYIKKACERYCSVHVKESVLLYDLLDMFYLKYCK